MTQLLQHLREIEKRRLFSDLGYGSLYEYVVKELRYSESAAIRRIKTARIAEEIPELESKIAEGVQNLSIISMAVRHFQIHQISDTNEKRNILCLLEGKSARECDQILLRIGNGRRIPTDEIRPLTPELLIFKVVIRNQTLANYDKIRDLMAHKDLTNDELLNFVFNVALENLLLKKYHLACLKSSEVTSNTRHIPAPVKRAVYIRDKGMCQNCKGSWKLEFDHVHPFAEGGESSVENLRLLCSSCNQRKRIKSGSSIPA